VPQAQAAVSLRTDVRRWGV